MKLLQNGYPKSGNYWLYKILDSIYKQAGVDKKSFIKNHPIHQLARNWELSYPQQAEIDMIDVLYVGTFYRISSIFRRKITDFNEYVSQTSHVWSHSNYCEKSSEVFSHFDKVVYIIRDPRDVLVSSANFAFTPYMQTYYPTFYDNPATYLDMELEVLCNHWSNHVMEYLERFPFDNIYFIFYENLLMDFDGELDNILRYLEIDLSDDQKLEVKESTKFKTMKADSPNHVNKANLYNWKFKLSAKQKQRVVEQIYPVLELLNYPIKDQEEKKPNLFKMRDKSNFEYAWQWAVS